ncbi:MAG: hypothetical protein Q4C55_07580 [Eubacterium sp.]|nr:hypothetical protein [Eubacterium sp.]
MYESEMKSLFLDVVSLLSLNREVTRETVTGQVLEYGMVLDEHLYLTYREMDKTLHFYRDDLEILRLTENSPVIWMIRELLGELEYTDPRELSLARMKRIK